MEDYERQHAEKLRFAHQRRLQILEMQAAQFGYLVPPHILTEIEDIRRDLELLNVRFSPRNSVSQPETQPVKTVLFISADPIDAARLRLGKEVREIQEKLKLSQLRDQFKLEQRFSSRPEDITQAVLDTQPQIIHFSGHGTPSGELCTENQLGRVHPIEPSALELLFEQFSQQINCVILNACYSEIQANAIAKHISYVIGMNESIKDEAAIAFSVGFYQALGAGKSIEESYKLGCVQIALQDISSHLIPILLHKK